MHDIADQHIHVKDKSLHICRNIIATNFQEMQILLLFYFLLFCVHLSVYDFVFDNIEES